MKEETIYVIGHKNPDTDSICAAIAYAELKKKEGINAKPARCGEINNETRYVLEYFGVEAPELIKDVSGKKIILVDHNEESHAVDGLNNAEILEIIDHHRSGGLKTSSPIFVYIEPIGCTSTIIAEFYTKKKIKLDKKLAGILISSILSDTNTFTSPTSTEKDKKIGKKLSKTAEIKTKKFGFEIKKAKANLAGKTPNQIIHEDLKEFEFKGNKISISQIEIFEKEEIYKLKDELIKELENIKQKNNHIISILAVTDIVNNASRLWAAGNKELIEKAFKKKFENNEIHLPGVVSRKKQIVPPIEEVMKQPISL